MHILRVVTVYEPDVRALPVEFRSVLTKQDIMAIRTGRQFFADLANAESPKWLQKVLKCCSESVSTLQFYATGEAPFRPYFRFYWSGSPAISLPRSKRLRSDLPAFLKKIYGVIGAFQENDFDMAGGLLAVDQLRPLSGSGIWVEPSDNIDPKLAIPFLECLSGDRLCYLPDGSGAWVESCVLKPVKNLEREVERYFTAILKGTRI